ncbi:MAG: ABC transporter ATP-binding protein [Candidatus Nanoarchaeia archaeon]
MHALSIKNLKKTYTNGVHALKGISFDVKKGDFFALLGPNGAGKTTTLGIVTDLVKKTEGKISVFGVDTDVNHAKAKQYLGVVPQEFNCNYFEKVEDIIVNQAGYYGIPRAEAKTRTEQLLKQLDLHHKRKHISKTLSGGMKRKLMIARALVHNPKLLLLDEPTAGVDVEARRAMWDFLVKRNKEGLTIILTTHYLEEAEQLCKNIGMIHNGDLIVNTSMKDFLKKLDIETFLLDVEKPLKSLKPIMGYDVKLIDKNTLQASVPKKQDLNKLFDALSKRGIKVISMRNKSNRLEELFMELTKNE